MILEKLTDSYRKEGNEPFSLMVSLYFTYEVNEVSVFGSKSRYCVSTADFDDVFKSH